jgi:hypothetical protein
MEIEFASGGRIRISGSSTVSAFKRDPRGGHLFVFRGRRGGLDQDIVG